MEGITPDGEIKDDARNLVMSALRSHFRPEFLNRVDEIVLFKPLTLGEIENIVELLLDDLRDRLAERRITCESRPRRGGSSPSRATTRRTVPGRSVASSPAMSRRASAVPCSGATPDGGVISVEVLQRARRFAAAPVPRREGRSMSTTLDHPTVQVVCPSCQAKNRIPTAAEGVPRCGRCHEPLPWGVDATDEDFAAIADEATIPVLVDIWAPWCGPCRMVSPG